MSQSERTIEIPVATAAHERPPLSPADQLRWHNEYDEWARCRLQSCDIVVCITVFCPAPTVKFTVQPCPLLQLSGLAADNSMIAKITLDNVDFDAKCLARTLFPECGDRHHVIASLGALPLWLKGMRQLTPDQRRELMEKCGCELHTDPWYFS